MSAASQTRINSSIAICTRQLEIERRLQVYDAISFKADRWKKSGKFKNKIKNWK